MALKEFIEGSFDSHWQWMERYVDGLTQAEIEFTPNDQCHSIGFILWHYGRARWICGCSRWPGVEPSFTNQDGRNGSANSRSPWTWALATRRKI